VLDVEAASRFGWTVEDLARACLDGGARFLQIRAKLLPAGPLLQLTDRILRLASARQALVIVNDRADIARLAGAHGVHVGQDDLSPAAVRRTFGSSLAIGLSTHDVDQISHALEQPIAYLAVGPVYATRTKETGYEPVGLELVRAARGAAAHRGVPIVAIGGITLDRAAGVIEAGAASVAVIGDLFTGGDPEARTRAFVERLETPPHV
jgi:thiamine-phosphate pyrophosphorylase